MSQQIEGTVTSVDPAGNLVTSISSADLEGVPRNHDEVRVTCGDHETFGIFDSTRDQPPMTLVAVVEDHGRLVISIVGDSAAVMLGEKEGTPVAVQWDG